MASFPPRKGRSVQRLPVFQACVAILALSACLAAGSLLHAREIISTAAGGGPDHLPGVSSNLSFPATVVATKGGDLYIAAIGQERIFRLDTAGQIHVVAGNGGSCFYSPYGEGGPARDACFYGPFGFALDSKG